MRHIVGVLAACGLAMVLIGRVQAEGPTEFNIGYVYPLKRALTLSLVDRPTADFGLAGANLAIADNNTTGRFTGQDFRLHPMPVDTVDADAIIEPLAANDVHWLVADVGADALLALADAALQADILVFNVGAPDDKLRLDACHANVVHVAPSRAMLADALAQYLAYKRWSRWFLVKGSHAEDEALAAALRRAAKRFGARLVEERTFEDTGGARTTDSGHVQVQRQLPVFLQNAPEHDVVVVADENEVFGTHVPYHTFDPRPVAGSAGLVPSPWSPAHEQWGAVQLQNRFVDQVQRRMTAVDMLAWMAVRMIGEAATRAPGAEPQAIREYILGPDFELAAFKGQALTIRDWNQQLRQPILLAGPKTVVSVSPQDGFLHPGSLLDTLGYDKPESACAL